MSGGRRSGSRRDPVGETVSRRHLAEDLARARSVLTPRDQELLDYILEKADDPERDVSAIRLLTGRIRVDAQLRERLLAYLDDGSSPHGACLWCGRALPPSTVGRPRRYCSDSHRQHGCRARKRHADQLRRRTGSNRDSP